MSLSRFLASVAVVFLAGSVPALAELSSAASFSAAQARAKSEGRLLFLMFTSSDCRHCKKFNEKVVDTEVFQTFAREHLSPIVYDVDAYAALPEDEHQFALSLEEKYGVEKLPAIVVYSPGGKELLKTQGYRGTEAEKIVEQLRSMVP